MRKCAIILMAAASLFFFTAEASAALCDKPKAWAGDPNADVVFTGVTAIESGRTGDGPNQPMPVSVNGDVLGLGEEISISSAGLKTQGPVICVRHRPEWLGLTVSNTGAEAVSGALTINWTASMKLEAALPILKPGEVRQILVVSGEPISAIAADAVELIRR